MTDLTTILQGHLLTQTTPDAPAEAQFDPLVEDIPGLGMDDADVTKGFEDLDEALNINDSLEALLQNLQRYSEEGLNDQAASFASQHLNYLRTTCGITHSSLESLTVASFEADVQDFIAKLKEVVQKILKKIIAAFSNNTIVADKKTRDIESKAKELLEKNKAAGTAGGNVGNISFGRMGWFAKDGQPLSSFNITHELQQSVAYVGVLTSALESSLRSWHADPVLLSILNKVDEKEGIAEYVGAPFAGHFELAARFPVFRGSSAPLNHGRATESLAKAYMQPMKSHTSDNQLEDGINRLYSADRARVCEAILAATREATSLTARIRKLNVDVVSQQSEVFKKIDAANSEANRNWLWCVSNGFKIHIQALQILHGYLLQYMTLCLRYVSESLNQEKVKKD